MLSCHDNFEANFDNYPSMLSYHQALSMASSWRRCKVKDLHVEPLDPTSPLYGHPAAFAAGTSEDAIKDTAANLGLALNVDGNIYPVRGTAYKTLTERAKINGTALPKLSRKDLANVLNACLSVHNSDALLLIRNEKVSAVHSGDETDYSVLPMDELLVTLDYLKNPHVKDGYFNLATMLAQVGIEYGTYLWDPQYKGLDDYVWHCRQEGLV